MCARERLTINIHVNSNTEAMKYKSKNSAYAYIERKMPQMSKKKHMVDERGEEMK
jgi:hypothetical protein